MRITIYKEVFIHYRMKNYRYQKVYHVVHKKIWKGNQSKTMCNNVLSHKFAHKGDITQIVSM